jgi:hypothetical protein
MRFGQVGEVVCFSISINTSVIGMFSIVGKVPRARETEREK